MRQLICRRTSEWLEIGYTYRAVRISYLVHLAEVAHIHTGYCKITTCYRARPDKRAQRVAFSNILLTLTKRVYASWSKNHTPTTHERFSNEVRFRPTISCGKTIR